MKRVILTIAIVLTAASAYADDHRWNRGESDNGNHYGYDRRHDSHRNHECREEREWIPRHVYYRPEYRAVRVVQPSYVTYRPEHRSAEPQVTVSIQTPGLILSFLTGR